MAYHSQAYPKYFKVKHYEYGKTESRFFHSAGCLLYTAVLEMLLFNPFSTNAPLLYPLKTSENRKFFDVLRGYRSGTLVENELMMVSQTMNMLMIKMIMIRMMIIVIIIEY